MTMDQMYSDIGNAMMPHQNHGAMTRYGPSGSEILSKLERRRADRGVIHEQMRRIRDAYNGDIIVPLPEMGTDEQSSVANLIVTGVDQTAQRIASVMPMIDTPSARQGFDVHDERARLRGSVIRNWWEENRMQTKMRRRARWLVGYASAPAVIRPDYNRRMPVWEIRDPLSAYPAPTSDPDDITPTDCIFTFYKGLGWLREAYPMACVRLMQEQRMDRVTGNELVELVEYVDCEVTVLAVLGFKYSGERWSESTTLPTRGNYIELERTMTPGGMCPAVIPGRITLERPRGQFDAAIGMYSMQARLMALEIMAVERGIFPDTYLVSRQGETAQFISGPHDGRTGEVNIIKGGDIKDTSFNPGFLTAQTIDKLERAQRITGGIPAEYGGESPVNVRTGRRGDAVMAAITSFPVQEAQEVLAQALQEENKRAIALDKHCFGGETKSFYYSWKGKGKAVTYEPVETFDIDVNRVTYPLAGADANGLIIGLGQRVGIGTMSKRTSMELDPMVADPEQENDRVMAEGLTEAVVASLQMQAQQGTIPPQDIADIAKFVRQGQGDIFAAVEHVQRKAQERQASSGMPGTPTGPAMPGSPEAQPGLAAPGMGAEMPSVAPPAPGMENVGDLMNLLRG